MFTHKNQRKIKGSGKLDGMYCNSFPARLLNRNKNNNDVNISLPTRDNEMNQIKKHTTAFFLQRAK